MITNLRLVEDKLSQRFQRLLVSLAQANWCSFTPNLGHARIQII